MNTNRDCVFERTEPIHLAGWSGYLGDNTYMDMFAAALDAGELLLFDHATGEARPPTCGGDVVDGVPVP